MNRLLIVFALMISAITPLPGFAQDDSPKQKLKTEKFTVGGDSFSIEFPDGWMYEKSRTNALPTSITLLAPKSEQRMMLTLIVPPSAPVKSQEAVEQIIRSRGQQFAGASVEKKTNLQSVESKGGPGCYATFSDARLEDKEPKAGEFRYITVAALLRGQTIVSVDLLSNDLESDNHKAAIEILKSGLKLTDSKPPAPITWDEPFTISAPGRKMSIKMQGPQLLQYSGQTVPNGFRFTANGKDNFNISAFVEEGKAGSSHLACYEHFWPKANKNPYIVQESVKMTEGKSFVEVKYDYKVEGRLMPNRNYYVAIGDQWVDVHVSVFPAKDNANKRLDEFGKQLKFVKTGKQPSEKEVK